MNGIIYNIENKINNKKYIGQTINKSEKRKYQHINHPDKYSVIDRAIQKYGEDNFEWKTLEENIDNQRDLNLLEKFWIINLETRTTQWGYNIKEGGSNGKHSEETKRKFSKISSGKNNPMYGKHHTDDSKKKISNAHKGENNPMYGKKHSEETKTKLSNVHIGKKHSTETKLKMSKNHSDVSGKNHPFYGKHHSEETKRKISESRKRVKINGDD